MGKFQPGQKKPTGSGRQKGTPNQRTQLLSSVVESLGLDVPQRLVELLPQLPPVKQADVLLELMSYLYPKRKAVEFPDLAIGPPARQSELEARYSQMSTAEIEIRYRELLKKALADEARDLDEQKKSATEAHRAS